MTREQIVSLIRNNDIKIYDKDDTKIMFAISDYDKAPEQTEKIILDNKAAILDYLYEQRDFAKRQKAFEESCGYNAVSDVYYAWCAYQDAMNEYMDSETPIPAPNAPEVTEETVKAQYPVGALYFEMHQWTNASNYSKVAAGKKAIERMVNGDDPQAAYDDAQKEWSKAAWDGMMAD
jgi:hypothetical protein